MYYMELEHPSITSKVYRLLRAQVEIYSFLTVEEYILMKEDKEEGVFIALKKESVEELREAGLKSVEDYIYIYDLCERLDDEEVNRIKNKSIIIWGAGRTSQEFIFKNKLEILYYIDSDKGKQGIFGKKKVYSTDVILNNKKTSSDIFIICCSSMHEKEMENVLKDSGWDEENYVLSQNFGKKYYNQIVKILTPSNADYYIEFTEQKDNKEREKIDVVCDEHIIDNIKTYYNRSNVKGYNVLDKDGNTIFYANVKEEGIRFWIKILFERWMEKECISFFAVFPNIKGIVFVGMDDVSMKFVYCCKKYDIPFRVEGEMWKNYVESAYLAREDEIEKLRKKGWKVIDNKRGINSQYKFLYRLLDENYAVACYESARYLNDNGVSAYRVSMPYSDLIENYSEDEEYCNTNGVYPYERPRGKEWAVHLRRLIDDEKLFGCYSGETWKSRRKAIKDGYTECYIDDNERKNTLYFVGPCVAAQVVHRLEDTLIYHLQKLSKDNYSVVALHFPQEQFGIIERIIKTQYYRPGDVVVFVHFCSEVIKDNNHYVDSTAYFNNRGDERWWFNGPVHLLELGNERFAQFIFEKCLLNEFNKERRGDALLPCSLTEKEEIAIERYTQKYVDYIVENTTNGAIVMNCNPFTLGHRYLIEYAASQVDVLYVFVVEENESFFTFNDRYTMVKRGVDDLSNVVVLPSGKMILSMTTMPAYFTKEEQQNATIDASYDLKLFGLGIAPAFHVTKRFVGNEIKDRITKQYNEHMVKILPKYGIEVVEIERKRIEGQVVSASYVRNALKRKDMRTVRRLTPKSTYDYIVEITSK